MPGLACCSAASKAWVAGTSPAMTMWMVGSRLPLILGSLNPLCACGASPLALETFDAGKFPSVPRPLAAKRRTGRPTPAGGHQAYLDSGGSGQDRIVLPQCGRLRHAGGVGDHPLARTCRD